MFAKGSCLPERSARRGATVTSSVPLAMSASRINSFDANFPVPTSRRDANSRSAIFSFEGLSAMRKDKRIHEHARMSSVAQASCLWGRRASCLSSTTDTRFARCALLGLRQARRPPASQTRCLCYFRFVTKFDLRRQDCIKGMARLADESVDLVVTSPPYNLGISYGKYSDRQDRRSFFGWGGELVPKNRRRFKTKGSFFLNTGAPPSHSTLSHS